MMFEALIVICMSTEQKDCSVIEDTRGPYTSERRCAQRTREMSDDILSLDKGYVVKSVRCETIEDIKRQFPRT